MCAAEGEVVNKGSSLTRQNSYYLCRFIYPQPLPVVKKQPTPHSLAQAPAQLPLLPPGQVPQIGIIHDVLLVSGPREELEKRSVPERVVEVQGDTRGGHKRRVLAVAEVGKSRESYLPQSRGV